MSKVLLLENIEHTLVTKIVPRQFEALDISQKVSARKMVKVASVQDGHVFRLESLNVSSELKLSYFFNDFVLSLLVKQKIEVNCEDFYVFVVVQDFFKKFILVSVEKVERLLGDTDLFGSFEKFDGLQVNFLQLDNFGFENPPA